MDKQKMIEWLEDRIKQLGGYLLTQSDERTLQIYHYMLAHLRQDVVGLPPKPGVCVFPAASKDAWTERRIQILLDYADALRSAAESMARDAARYRWIRHGDNDDEVMRFLPHGEPYILRNEELDAAIDEAARKGAL